jgi:hypothetical protein
MCQLRHDHSHSSLQSRLSALRGRADEETEIDSPAGAIELDDADLGLATGGLLTGACGCSGGCSHHCQIFFNPGAAVINPVAPIIRR